MDIANVDLPEELVRAFCSKWRITEFAVFGSVLREDFSPASDIDVLVTFEVGSPWRATEMVRMEKELALIIGREVDLVEKQAVLENPNPATRHAILDSARVLNVA